MLALSLVLSCASQKSAFSRYADSEIKTSVLSTAAESLAGNTVAGIPTDTSCAFNVFAQKDMSAYLEYKASDAVSYSRTSVATSAEGDPILIKLEGLIPDTRYSYIVHYKLNGASEYASNPAMSFSTQKSAGSSFSFGVQGDSHPERKGKMFSSDLYLRTMDNALKANLDFYFTLGDDFSIDHLYEKKQVTKSNIESVYQLQRNYLGKLGTPLFLVNGNHEQAAKCLLDGTPESGPVLAGNARIKHYPLPKPDAFYGGDLEEVEHVGLPRDYYSFTWGDALFVAIDPYWHSDVPVDSTIGGGKSDGKGKRDLWQVTLGDVQYEWLKETLEQSKSRYKFVFEHHILGTGRGGIENAKLFEWGGYGQNGKWEFDTKRPGWELPIHKLFVKTGVTIFFQGHDHFFARQELDGVVYQSVPNPADDTYTAFNKDAYKSGDILPNSGFLNVTVSPGQVKVDYVRSFLAKDETGNVKNGSTAFSYTIGGDSGGSGDAGGESEGDGNQETASESLSCHLGRPTQKSVSFNILSGTDSQVRIRYGTASGNYDNATKYFTAKAGAPIEVTLGSLTADKQHFFKLESQNGKGETASLDEGNFRTARSSGSSFVFDVQADPHLDEQSTPDIYAQTLANIASDKPDFLFDLGDTFMTEKLESKTEENIRNRYLLTRSYFDRIGNSVPLFLVPGNHDGEAGWNFADKRTSLAALSRKYRFLHFQNPYPDGFYTGNTQKEGSRHIENYFSFTWGDALFVTLDPYLYTAKKPAANGWGWTLGKTQYDWLKKILESSKAKFKFVFIHQLVGGSKEGRGGVEFAKFHEWGGSNADGSNGFAANRSGWAMPIHKLLAANKVDIVFKGHDHFFAKQELDGVVYQTLPQPSHAGDKLTAAKEYGYVNGSIIGGSGHLRVTVSGSRAKVEFVKAANSKGVAFAYEVY